MWRTAALRRGGPRPSPICPMPTPCSRSWLASGVVQHTTGARAPDGAIWKYVSVAGAAIPRIVLVGLPVPDSSPVSPRFAETLPG